MLQMNLIQIPLKSMKRLPLIAIRHKGIKMHTETWSEWKIEAILEQNMKDSGKKC